jgi:hypothetical protein
MEGKPMKAKQLKEILTHIDDEEQIAVLFWTRDEFEDDNGEEITTPVWNKAVTKFENMNVDQYPSEALQEQVTKAAKAAK